MGFSNPDAVRQCLEALQMVVGNEADGVAAFSSLQGPRYVLRLIDRPVFAEVGLFANKKELADCPHHCLRWLLPSELLATGLPPSFSSPRSLSRSIAGACTVNIDCLRGTDIFITLYRLSPCA